MAAKTSAAAKLGSEYKEGDTALYIKHGNAPVSAEIVKVHYDTAPVLYFTIRLPDGRERQTDEHHLRKKLHVAPPSEHGRSNADMAPFSIGASHAKKIANVSVKNGSGGRDKENVKGATINRIIKVSIQNSKASRACKIKEKRLGTPIAVARYAVAKRRPLIPSTNLTVTTARRLGLTRMERVARSKGRVKFIEAKALGDDDEETVETMDWENISPPDSTRAHCHIPPTPDTRPTRSALRKTTHTKDRTSSIQSCAANLNVKFGEVEICVMKQALMTGRNPSRRRFSLTLDGNWDGPRTSVLIDDFEATKSREREGSRTSGWRMRSKDRARNEINRLAGEQK